MLVICITQQRLTIPLFKTLPLSFAKRWRARAPLFSKQLKIEFLEYHKEKIGLGKHGNASALSFGEKLISKCSNFDQISEFPKLINPFRS